MSVCNRWIFPEISLNRGLNFNQGFDLKLLLDDDFFSRFQLSTFIIILSISFHSHFQEVIQETELILDQFK